MLVSMGVCGKALVFISHASNIHPFDEGLDEDDTHERGESVPLDGAFTIFMASPVSPWRWMRVVASS